MRMIATEPEEGTGPRALGILFQCVPGALLIFLTSSDTWSLPVESTNDGRVA